MSEALKKFPIKMKFTKVGKRGCEDPNEILDAICNDWAELQQELDKFGGSDL